MEILSTGQKIKRARIYKGITLKELCGDEISISKMSCIENEKIKPDEEIVKYISKIIDVDYDYLMLDVLEQIKNNLDKYKQMENFDEDTLKDIYENINSANEYQYYDESFELYHLLYRNYIRNSMLDECDKITKEYYSSYKKAKNEENIIIYYYDMAAYLYWREEYVQASVYYTRLAENLFASKESYTLQYRKAEFYIGVCYYKAGEISKAYDVLKKLIDSEKNTKDEQVKKIIYKYFALACIKLGSSKQNEFLMKYENIRCERKQNALQRDKLMFASAYFYVHNVDKALLYIREAIESFDKNDISTYVTFLSDCIEVLINNKQYEYAMELTEENLNKAIQVDDIKLVERAYYLKGTVLQLLERYEEADRCMNLSLDSLFKFGSKNERFTRHLHMALMYYKLGQTMESVKYFNFALKLKHML